MKGHIQLQIVPAGEADFPELHLLAAGCFGSDWTWLNSLGVLTLPKILRFKATDINTGKMIGFIASEIPNDEAVSWILSLGVDPEYRRLGVAQRLLAVHELTSTALRFRLCVRRSNESAQRLYEEVGYQQVGVWANYYLNEDAFVFEKKSIS
ncbi:MAG: GNAT family N-acetyltransferase [Anaerolineaceae bacterium]|nr:GNAT family N-acetyltransferase [Anaerolineaceae bacterium]